MGCLPSKERLTAVNDCAPLNTISSVAPEGEPISREDSGEERTSRADSGGSLSALLELEYFLVKVLFHLVDDGLHECRRVCRLWRKVCSRLPVRIRFSRPTEVRMTAHKFPMAASLVLSRCVSDDDLSMSHAIPLLPRMGNLRSLHLDLHPRRTIPVIIHSYLESMDSLRHLSLRIESEAVYHSAIEAIRCLGQIESLSLEVFAAVQVDPNPVTEIRGLRSLSAPLHVLVARNGARLFPSLTQLTGLRCSDDTASHVRRVVEREVRSIPRLFPYPCSCCRQS